MRSFLKLSLIFALFSVALADVAPDPGYANVSSGLVLESDSDLSAYRFFLESPLEVEEIRIASGGPTRIDATGRAGAAKFAKLIAVPIKDMTISGDLSGALLESMIREERFPNAQLLLSHSFQAIVPITEKAGWQDPVYRISTSGDGITATPIAGGSPSGGRLTYSIWQFVWRPVAVAGLLLAAGLAIAGVWLIRRKKRVV